MYPTTGPPWLLLRDREMDREGEGGEGGRDREQGRRESERVQGDIGREEERKEIRQRQREG